MLGRLRARVVWAWRVMRDGIIPGACVRCGGSGIEPTLEDVACLRCDATGCEMTGPLIRVRVSREFLTRVALGEFRRSRP